MSNPARHETRRVGSLPRVAITGLILALAGLAVGGAWLTRASGAEAPRNVTFTVKQTLTSFHIIDLGAKGWTPGDMTTFTKTFRNLSGDATAQADGNCVITRVGKNEPTAAECGQTFRFKAGAIQSNTVDLITPPKAVLPIIGGTGRYEGVTGQILAGFRCADCFTFQLEERH